MPLSKSANVIKKFVEKNNLFKKIKTESACVLFERYDNWFSYYKQTAPSEQIQNTVNIFDKIHLIIL